MHVRTLVIGLVVLFLLTSASLGVGTSESVNAEAASFDELLTVGMTQVAIAEADAEGYTVPRAQVYYSGFRYAVGYYGISTLIADLHREGHTRAFGQPLVVYVSDFAGASLELTPKGYPSPSGDPGWISASDAYFVVESNARTPVGAAIIPFSDRGAAHRFVEEYGGRIVDWAVVRGLPNSGGRRTVDGWERTISTHHEEADRTVRRARQLRHRPVTVVVGEEASSIQGAIQQAPPNTTIYIPPGRYRVGHLTINKSVTIRGAGNETHLVGNGNGTVLTVRSPRSAVMSLRISGIGDKQAHSLENATDWEAHVRLAYALADAGVRFVRANGSLAADLFVRTPANGIVFIESDQSVVENVTVHGDSPWTAGYMDVLAFRSRLVVQDSVFRGGRDAVYTHRSHGIVVRDNRMVDQRFGVHEMYTSRGLIANNTIRNATLSGVIVMTNPRRNAIVANDIRGGNMGVSVAGHGNYVADNVLVNNELGMTVQGGESIYTGNVLGLNDFGARVDTLLPSNRVWANDFVSNDRHVEPGRLGTLHVWTVSGRGNYWSEAPGFDRDRDGVLDRSFRPTGILGGDVYRTGGGPTLARAPAVSILHDLQQVMPGMQETGVLDTAPLSDPVHHRLIDQFRRDKDNQPAETRDTSPRVDTNP